MSSIRRASALTSVSGLLLGVLAGVGVGTAGPASAAPALTVLGDSSYVDSMGITHVLAQLENAGSDSAVNHVDLFLYDAAGNVIGSEGDDSLVLVLGPGERSPVDVQLPVPLPAGYDHYSVQDVVGSPSSSPPNHNFTTTVTTVFRDPAGGRQILGTIRNNNTAPADNLQVVFTFFDASHKILGAEVAYPDVAGPVTSGGSSSFTEIVNADIPAYASYTWLTQSTSPAAPVPAAAPAGADPAAAPATDPAANPAPAPVSDPALINPPPAETPLTCNPTMSLSTHRLALGQGASVSVSGTPGSTLTLEGFGRPSTTYLPIRSDVLLAAGGAQSFTVHPATNGQIRVRVRGCATPGVAQTISVVPGLSLSVTRLGPRRYRFSGRILPGPQNTGRVMTLYARPLGGSRLATATVRSASDGSYSAVVSFPSTRSTMFSWATAATAVGGAAASPSRTLTTG